MSKAIDDLMHEHDAILFTLKVLGRMTALIREGKTVEAADPLALVAFLKEFADKCHHGKEEGILFPALEKAGIRREGGPVGVMLQEHEEGRAFIREMSAGLEAKDLPRFAEAADGYAELLSGHIEKENTILFPMGEQALSPAVLSQVYEAFEEHEDKVIGQGRHEELHAMLDAFEAKYLKPGLA